ncbi:MAG: methionyl-tRNA formyltransferase [Alphaproteobacteria bacterium]
MRIVFMGSPEFSVGILKELHKVHEIVAVYSQPPKPAGRGYKLTKCAVHQAAEDFGLNVHTPKSLRNLEAQAEFAAHNADVAIVVAYGLILPEEILNAPKDGCINIHASLLPRWRGAAPIQRAIEAGDTETGITYMQMDEGLDTGDELQKIIVPITTDETGGSLHDKLAKIGAQNINGLLANLNNITPQKQSEVGVTYAHKLSRNESKVDWNCPAQEIERRLRAFTPWPGLYTEYQGERIRLLGLRIEDINHEYEAGLVLDTHLLIACHPNAVRITRLQKSGKKPMDSKSFLLGNPIGAKTKFDN